MRPVQTVEQPGTQKTAGRAQHEEDGQRIGRDPDPGSAVTGQQSGHPDIDRRLDPDIDHGTEAERQGERVGGHPGHRLDVHRLRRLLGRRITGQCRRHRQTRRQYTCDHVQSLPGRRAAGQEISHDGRPQDGSNAEEALDRVHGRGMGAGRCRDVPYQGQGGSLEDPDGQARDKQQDEEEAEAVARDEQQGAEAEGDQTDQYRRLAPQPVGQKPQTDAREGDAGHGRIMKRARDRLPQAELLDHLGNDDPDRVGRHGEHHEHQIGQDLDGPDAGWAIGDGHDRPS